MPDADIPMGFTDFLSSLAASQGSGGASAGADPQAVAGALAQSSAKPDEGWHPPMALPTGPSAAPVAPSGASGLPFGMGDTPITGAPPAPSRAPQAPSGGAMTPPASDPYSDLLKQFMAQSQGSRNPMQHMSLGTALALAFNPQALTIMSHLQNMSSQQHQENLRNMEFAALLTQHKQAADEHAQTAGMAKAEFERKLGEAGWTKQAADFKPDPNDPHPILPTPFGTFKGLTPQEREGIKRKDTTEVPVTIGGKTMMIEGTNDEIIKTFGRQREMNEKGLTWDDKGVDENGHTVVVVRNPNSFPVQGPNGKDIPPGGSQIDDSMRGKVKPAGAARAEDKVGTAKQQYAEKALTQFGNFKAQAQAEENAYKQAQAELQSKVDALEKANEARVKLGNDASAADKVHLEMQIHQAEQDRNAAQRAMDTQKLKRDLAWNQTWGHFEEMQDSPIHKEHFTFQGTRANADEPVIKWKGGMQPGLVSGGTSAKGSTAAGDTPAQKWTSLTPDQQFAVRAKYNAVKAQPGAREAFKSQWGIDPEQQ